MKPKPKAVTIDEPRTTRFSRRIGMDTQGSRCASHLSIVALSLILILGIGSSVHAAYDAFLKPEVTIRQDRVVVAGEGVSSLTIQAGSLPGANQVGIISIIGPLGRDRRATPPMALAERALRGDQAAFSSLTTLRSETVTPSQATGESPRATTGQTRIGRGGRGQQDSGPISDGTALIESIFVAGQAQDRHRRSRGRLAADVKSSVDSWWAQGAPGRAIHRSIHGALQGADGSISAKNVDLSQVPADDAGTALTKLLHQANQAVASGNRRALQRLERDATAAGVGFMRMTPRRGGQADAVDIFLRSMPRAGDSGNVALKIDGIDGEATIEPDDWLREGIFLVVDGIGAMQWNNGAHHTVGIIVPVPR